MAIQGTSHYRRELPDPSLDPETEPLVEVPPARYIERLDAPLAQPDNASKLSKRFRWNSGDPKSWRQAIRAYRRDRIGEQSSENTETKHQRAKRHYGRLFDGDRRLREGLTNCYTVLLTCRVQPRTGSEWVPPRRIGNDVANGRNALLTRLRTVMRRCDCVDRWSYFSVIAGNGPANVPHLHVLIYASVEPDGHLRQQEFEPVLQSFIDSAHLAPNSGDGNDPTEGAIRVYSPIDRQPIERTAPDSDKGPVSRVARYIGYQLPHLTEPHSAELQDLAHGCTVSAMDSKAVTMGQAFQNP